MQVTDICEVGKYQPMKKQLFQANFISSLFSSCLMLKVFKLQIISDRNVNKRISHKTYHKLSQDNPSRKSSLKVVSAAFVLVCFACLKERTYEARKNVFLFHFKSSFRSWDNQILNFQIFKCYDVIKYLSMKHETHFIE